MASATQFGDFDAAEDDLKPLTFSGGTGGGLMP